MFKLFSSSGSHFIDINSPGRSLAVPLPPLTSLTAPLTSATLTLWMLPEHARPFARTVSSSQGH